MYKRILVPVDGSELSESTFHYARELALKLGVEVILLHVANPQRPELLPMFLSYVQHSAEIVSRPPKAKAGSKTVKAKGEVIGGYPADGILRFAEDNKVDLILIASHGRSGIKRQILGSVADRVLRASKVPVWLVPAQTKASGHKKWAMKKILVPLDGSELAECVLPHVESIAKGCSVESVTFVSVVEPVRIPYADDEGYSLSAKELERMESESRATSERYLNKLVSRVKYDGINIQSKVLTGGQAADMIADYATEKEVDLIIIATHGRSGISRWVWGSVADRILRSACVPVLMVRSPGCVPAGI